MSLKENIYQKLPLAFLLGTVILVMHSCAPAPRYRAGKIPSSSEVAHSRVEIGIASYYGRGFHGRRTASGEVFDMYGLTAAHRTLPFGTRIRVTNLHNGRTVVVRVNDRGPFVKNRILDLSYAAAREIGIIATGTAKVKIKVLKWGKD